MRGALLFFFCAALAATVASGEDRPDWIPVGAVSEELERQALTHRAFLQNRSREVQQAGLQAIRADLDRYDAADLRLAVVPLVRDMLGLEYRILDVSSRYRVDTPTRVDALQLLWDIGGSEAREQLRESISVDTDATVRGVAATLLAQRPSPEPDRDLQSVADALYRATRRSSSEAELHRLLRATERISQDVWDPQSPELLQALTAIVTGPYPSSLRRTAFAMLEDLSRR